MGFVILASITLACTQQEKTILKTQHDIQEIPETEIIEDDITTEHEMLIQAPIAPNGFDPRSGIYALRNSDIDELLSLQNEIRILTIYTTNNPIEDFSFIDKLLNLELLHISSGREENVDLYFLRYIHNIENLWLDVNFTTIDGTLLQHFEYLKRLTLGGTTVVNLIRILELPNLESLSLRVNFRGDPIIIENISTESRLKFLDIFAGEVDLEYIRNFQQLNHLRLHSSHVTNLHMLDNTELETLVLELFIDHREKINMEAFQKLNQLRNLIIIGFDIYDVRPLLSLPNLVFLMLRFNEVDIMPLTESETLRAIDISSDIYQNIQADIFTEQGIMITVEDRF